MLKIVNRPEFTQPVVMRTAHTQGDFWARFVALPSSELRALEAQAAAEGKGLAGVLPHVTLEIGDIELPGNPTPTLEQALDHPGIGPAMVDAYYRGLWQEKQGNSARPSAGS